MSEKDSKRTRKASRGDVNSPERKEGRGRESLTQGELRVRTSAGSFLTMFSFRGEGFGGVVCLLRSASR